MASQPRSTTRPYRSKRRRPCDHCRNRKVCCRIEVEPPCDNCQRSDVPCTFIQPASKRPRLASPPAAITPPERQPWYDFNMDFDFAPELYQNMADGMGDDFMAAHDAVNGYIPDMALPYGGDEAARHVNIERRGRLPPSDCTPIVDLTNPTGKDCESGIPDSLPPLGQVTNDLDPNQQFLPETPSREEEILYQNSLDQFEGFSGQLFGLSSESDPYLLRHFRWDENGYRRFMRVHFRRVGPDESSKPAHSKQIRTRQFSSNPASAPDLSVKGVPIHFALAKDELFKELKSETGIQKDMAQDSGRKALDSLVPPEDGRRMVSLFFKYVFPSFPVISRTEFGITSTTPLPSLQVITTIPIHLLAAIYASTLRFCPYDDHLCILNGYELPESSRIWRIAYEALSSAVHTPHLSVIQASLLYIEKAPTGASCAAADTPYIYSQLGSIVTQAFSMGLHLDCQDWYIPAWEKRLRRRLWWAVFVEDKWRCIFRGMPSLVSDDQWDVSELTDRDFVLESLDEESPSISTPVSAVPQDDENGAQFRYLTGLALIIADIYTAFYTLKTSKRLSSDLFGSLEAARPIRQRLQTWHASLPQTLQIHQPRDLDEPSVKPLSTGAPLQFSYLMAETFLYRALLRPLGRSRLKNLNSGQTILVQPFNSSSAHGFDILDHINNFHMTASAAMTGRAEENLNDAMLATVNAAEYCAKLVLTFTADLDSGDFTAFWYPWLRIGFSTMSNFIVLLYAQAPTEEHLLSSRKLAEKWRETLRRQSKSFDMMKLGLLRLDSIFWIGLDNILKDPI